jgi:hypothetical protein
MKLLYLTYPRHDYLADQIYTGLCKLIGWETITDFPYKPHYHDPAYRVPSVPQNQGRPYELKELIAKLERKEFDLLVLSTERSNRAENIRQKTDLPPRVMIVERSSEYSRRSFYHFQLSLYFRGIFQLSWVRILHDRLDGGMACVWEKSGTLSTDFSALFFDQS